VLVFAFADNFEGLAFEFVARVASESSLAASQLREVFFSWRIQQFETNAILASKMMNTLNIQ
jgi:hypothetical protein